MSEQPRVLIVYSTYYADIARQLLEGATHSLDEAGIAYDQISVPGAFEIPAAIRFALGAMEAQTADTEYAGFIALGTVIRGETDHYDHICREVSRALMDITVEQSVALGFGILTCENQGQAMARADVAQGNKGRDAALACLRMMALKKEFRLVPR